MGKRACLVYSDKSGLAFLAATQFLQEVEAISMLVNKELVEKVREFRDEELVPGGQFEFPDYIFLQDRIQQEIQSLKLVDSQAGRATVAALRGLFAKLQVLETYGHVQLSPKAG